MKRFIRTILPHVAIALCLCMMTVVVVGLRNPMVGLLSGNAFLIFSLLTGFSALTCCAVLFLDNRPSNDNEEDDKENDSENNAGEEKQD